ncbi:MAG: hypothetical protein JWQ57_755 [Mucilaginibacter sp.]|nr:hypothetical protein [Mucilaginibacter sp.]
MSDQYTLGISKIKEKLFVKHIGKGQKGLSDKRR